MWAVILASIVAFILYLRGREPPIPYPPHPKPKPFLGNALDIPKKEPWVKYREWSKRLGSDIIYMNAMGTDIIVLNKMEDAIALLDKRSAVYSSRPGLKIRNFMHMGSVTASLPYGDEWRKHRKIAQEGLKKDLMPSYHHMQSERVHQFLGQLLRDPSDYRELCKSLGSSVTLATAFGYDLESHKHDRIVDMGDAIMREFVKVTLPGSTLIHLFPSLRHIPTWVPGATAQRIIKKVKYLVTLYRNEPYDYAKTAIANGTLRDCLLSNLLPREDEYGAEILKDAMGSLYLAGGDTLTSFQETFIFLMILHPDKQKRAQAEIDSIVGTDRLPSFGDRDSLPYVEAIYREVLRWRPTALLNAPHTTIQDDIYKGYYIPKGAAIFANLWAISKDETIYRDPDSYMPERFLNPDGSLNDDDVSFVFGFGRRICAGRHMAESLLWFVLVSVLAAFDLGKAKDEYGNEIDLDVNEFVDAVISHPKPYKCSITPRSRQAESLINDSIGAA